MMALSYGSFDPDQIDWSLIFTQQSGNNPNVRLAHFSGIPHQRGSNIFRSIFKYIIPILKSSGKVVGNELLSTASKTLADAAAGRNLKESIKEHGSASIQNLVDKGASAVKRKMQKGGRAVKKRPPSPTAVIVKRARRGGRRRSFLH